MKKVKISGVGMYLPGPRITNEELSKRLLINEEWINQYIGTKSRHFSIDLNSGNKVFDLSDICVEAAKSAINIAKISHSDIDAVVMATATPDNLMPATVNIVADKLGLNNIPTFQIQSGCAGAIQALQIATQMFNAPNINNVLVIGGDVCNKFLNIKQDFSLLPSGELINYVLFGDGAGAIVLTNNLKSKGMIVNHVTNKFTGYKKVPGQLINWFGIENNNSPQVNSRAIMEDYKAIEHNVPPMAKELLYELLSTVDWEIEDVDYFLTPQLSKVMSEKIIKYLDIPMYKTINCVEDFGNTGNALPFIQLTQLYNKLSSNKKIILLAIESSKWLKSGAVFYGTK